MVDSTMYKSMYNYANCPKCFSFWNFGQWELDPFCLPDPQTCPKATYHRGFHYRFDKTEWTLTLPKGHRRWVKLTQQIMKRAYVHGNHDCQTRVYQTGHESFLKSEQQSLNVTFVYRKTPIDINFL